MNIETLHDSKGRKWQEVNSKAYSLKDVVKYLENCMEAPQNDTAVRFTIRDDGEIVIRTYNEDLEGEAEGSGFTAIQEGGEE